MRITAFLAAIGLSMASTALAAEALYAATARSPLPGDAEPGAGSLYRIDVAKGDIALVGVIRVDGMPVGITGLAEDPRTGVVYGMTSASSQNYPHSLVTIDLASAAAKLIGDVGVPASDIAFDAKGNLFAWLRLTRQLAVLDTSNAAPQPIGPAGLPTETGGLAIDDSGRAYVAYTGATGTLDTVDTNSGVITPGPRVSGAPFHGINSLTITPRGRLFAVNTNLGRPASALLIALDPATGAASQLGPLPNDADALVFVEPPWQLSDLIASRGALTAAAAVAVLLVVAAFVSITSRRR